MTCLQRLDVVEGECAGGCMDVETRKGQLEVEVMRNNEIGGSSCTRIAPGGLTKYI